MARDKGLLMKNYYNINWLLSRLLEKVGIKLYIQKVEFACHFFAGFTFALLGIVTSILWTIWTLVDEFYFDGYKGKDTWTDLFSKLIGVVIVTAWRLL